MAGFDNAQERGIIKGTLFEVAIMYLLQQNSFSRIQVKVNGKNTAVDRIRETRERFIELKGRGEWHQIDCPCEYDYISPFLYPIRLIGEVKYPGVVVLKEGSRVVDAIEAAGGETDDADLNSLNLAYMLNDGEKIYVPNKQETKDENKNYIEEGGGTNISQAGTDQNNSKNEKININTAGEDELMKITGIGESTAKKIIEYRNQNGRFKTIEDIKKIPGIVDSKYNNMKEEIRVK